MTHACTNALLTSAGAVPCRPSRRCIPHPPPEFADGRLRSETTPGQGRTGIGGALSGLSIFVASFVDTVSQSLLKPETRHLMSQATPVSAVLSPMLCHQRSGQIKPLLGK